MKTLARTIVALAAFASAYTFTMAGANATPAPSLSPEYTWPVTVPQAIARAASDDAQIGKAVSVVNDTVTDAPPFHYTPGDPNTPDVASARDSIIYGVPYNTPRALWPAWTEDAATDLRLLSCDQGGPSWAEVEASIWAIEYVEGRVADGTCVVIGTIAPDGRTVAR